MKRLAPVLALGGLAFLLVAGAAVLAPWRDGWLGGDMDTETYRLGWLFFRDSPWSWPPAANPRYGLELGSSIFYADIIPLLALPMKALHGLVPVGQYFGAWLLLCCILQAVFAAALLGRIGVAGREERLFGAALLVLAPFFLFRVGLHVALAGQWLLLAALWLAAGPRAMRRGGAWLWLVSIASLVHATLLALVGAIWIADLAMRLAAPGVDRRRLAAEALAVPALAAGGLWLGGFFAVTDGVQLGAGYGHYAMDLLGFANAPGGWSLLLPAWTPPEAHEGQAVFVGAGGLLVLVAGAVALLHPDTRAQAWRGLRRRWLLGLVLAGLVLLAVSHRATVAGFGPFLLPVPEAFTRLMEPFRSSSRLAWPALYAALVFGILLVCRRWRPAVAQRLLLLAACLQLVDTVGGWGPIQAGFRAAPAQMPAVFADPFWPEAARRYARLRVLPPSGRPDFQAWAGLADLAHRTGMATDIAYLARISRQARADAVAAAEARVAAGRYEPGSLYVVRPDWAARVRETAAETDLLAGIDGVLVLAPGWRAAPTREVAPAP